MPAPLPAEVRIIPRRGSTRRRVVPGILAALALAVLALNVVPGLSLSMPAPARHAAARPVPPPPVHVTVGRVTYSCTVALPPANIKGRS